MGEWKKEAYFWDKRITSSIPLSNGLQSCLKQKRNPLSDLEENKIIFYLLSFFYLKQIFSSFSFEALTTFFKGIFEPEHF